MITRNKTLNYLKRLIAVPTENPPGNEVLAANYIKEELEKAGIIPEIQPISRSRANIIARIGDPNRHTIILNGHLDVVPAGKGWDTEPYKAIIKDGYCYGRGSSDMKGGLAAMLTAFINIYLMTSLSNICLILAFTCDEEINGTGTKAFLEQYAPAAGSSVIIGEPTNMAVDIAHRGVVRFKLKVYGRQAHSAFPEQGCNAVQALCRLVNSAEKYHQQRQKQIFPLLPPPTVSCTVFCGGEKDNIIPPYAECLIDCRTIPGDTSGSLKRELESVLNQTSLPGGATYELEPYVEMPPGVTDINCKTVTLAKCVCEQSGMTIPVKDFPACSDLPLFTSAGHETVLWGPGDINEAHAVNEKIDLMQVYKMASLYQKFIVLADKSGYKGERVRGSAAMQD